MTYHSYGLLNVNVTVQPDQIQPLAPGHRPFEVAFARKDAQAPANEKSAWWSRHGHDKVTEIPDHYSDAHKARIQRRLDIIAANPKIAHLEQATFKRRWQTPDLAKETEKAARSWLLDRLEDLFAEEGDLSEPSAYTLEQVVASWRSPCVVAVVQLWRGRSEVDLTLAAEELLNAESLPDNPERIYSASGKAVLDKWKHTWHLQDLEDAGTPPPEIPLPPKFKKGDFAKAAYYKIRGKLNVPRERFIRFGELEPPRYGWNGWRDQQRSLAQVEAYTVAEDESGMALPLPTANDPRRCGATRGLWESLGDLKRWGEAEVHNEIEALAQEVCQQTRCPCALVERWQAWSKGDLEITTPEPEPELAVTVEQRAAVLALLPQLGPQQPLLPGAAARPGTQVSLPATEGWIALSTLQERWPGEDLEAVLDDLVASGDVERAERGDRRRFRRAR